MSNPQLLYRGVGSVVSVRDEGDFATESIPSRTWVIWDPAGVVTIAVARRKDGTSSFIRSMMGPLTMFLSWRDNVQSTLKIPAFK
jgi:hypothetical protein